MRVRRPARDPVAAHRREPVVPQRRMLAPLHHVEHVGRHVLGRHVPRLVLGGIRSPLHPADAQPLALPQGVIHHPLVRPQHAPVVERADLAGARRQVALQKLAKRPLADETDPGRILLLRHRQFQRPGDSAHLALVEPPQRKHRARKLRLVEPVEEIALILRAVLGLEELIRRPLLVLPAPHLRIVPRGDALGP